MTAFDDSGGGIHRRDPTEELIDELTADTPAGTRAESLVTEFLLELRSQYATAAPPQLRTALAEFVDVDLSNQPDLRSPAGSVSHRPATHPPVLPAWDTTATTRRTRVPSYIASFLGTVTGKIVLGAAVATASVGGAQATGVIDIPTLPSPDDDPGVVEIDDAPVGDVEDGPETEVDDDEPGDVDDDDVGDVDDDDAGDVDDDEAGDVDDDDAGDVDDGDVGDVDEDEAGDGDDGPEAELEEAPAGDDQSDPATGVDDGQMDETDE
jgi:hypothetical protein